MRMRYHNIMCIFLNFFHFLLFGILFGFFISFIFESIFPLFFRYFKFHSHLIREIILKHFDSVLFYFITFLFDFYLSRNVLKHFYSTFETKWETKKGGHIQFLKQYGRCAAQLTCSFP